LTIWLLCRWHLREGASICTYQTRKGEVRARKCILHGLLENSVARIGRKASASETNRMSYRYLKEESVPAVRRG
jgi:hypothetical protein